MKRFRTLPQRWGMLIMVVILIPYLIWSVPTGIRIFTSDEYDFGSTATKLVILLGYSIFLVVAVSTICLSLFIWYHFSTRWAITESGLEGLSPFGRRRFIPWDRVQSVHLCVLYGRNGYPIPGARFSLDKEQDEKIKGKTCGLISGWPKWLDSTYVFSRPAKYVFIYYHPEMEEELRKYLPDVEDIRESQYKRT